MLRQVRQLPEWPQQVLLARARLLLLELDPDKLNPPKRHLKKVYWHELVEIVKEVDRRGLQGRLF